MHAAFPATELKVPAGQRVADVLPVPEAKDPGGASVQELWPAFELKVPTGQRVADVLPVPEAKDLAGHRYSPLGPSGRYNCLRGRA